MSYIPNNPQVLNANLDAEVGRRLSREQALTILDAPRGASMDALAKQLRVRITLVKHVRYRCKWIRDHTQRPTHYPEF